MSQSDQVRFGRTPVLGLSERWSLARHNVGNPIIVVFSATLPRGLVSEIDLQEAVGQLSNQYPMLKCAVQDRTTKEPKYRMMDAYDPKGIVSVSPLAQDMTLPQILLESVMRGVEFDADQGPLWEVQLHQAEHSYQRDQLILIMDHIICDGVGSKNLFSELLGQLSAPNATSHVECTILPKRLDDFCDLKPLAQPTPRPSPPLHLKSFPGKQPGYSARTASQQFFTFSVPRDRLSKLITAGKQHDVRTLHPILYVAGLLALYRATLPDSGRYFFGTATPFSHRDEADNPACTGNYVTFHIKDEVILPNTRFWERTREFSEELRHPETKQNTKRALGGFAAFSDVPVVEGSERTGWEDAIDGLIDHVDGSHQLAYVVSNVGVMKVPKEGKLAGVVQDVCFAQTSSSHAGAFLNSVSLLC